MGRVKDPSGTLLRSEPCSGRRPEPLAVTGGRSCSRHERGQETGAPLPLAFQGPQKLCRKAAQRNRRTVAGIDKESSLNAIIGGKSAHFIDLHLEVILSPDQYATLYMHGFPDLQRRVRPAPCRRQVATCRARKRPVGIPAPFEIASDQIRSLRSRALVADLTSGAASGVLVRMGNSVREMDVNTATGRAVGFYDVVQSDQQAAAAADHPTT